MTLAVLAADQPAGLGVADEFFLGRVELQIAAKPGAEIAQVAKRGRKMPRLGVGVEPRGPTDRIQEVALVRSSGMPKVRSLISLFFSP